jgi:hypothetical protein
MNIKITTISNGSTLVKQLNLDTSGEVWSYVVKSKLSHHLSSYRKFLKNTIGYKQYTLAQIPNTSKHLAILSDINNLLSFLKSQPNTKIEVL